VFQAIAEKLAKNLWAIFATFFAFFGLYYGEDILREALCEFVADEIGTIFTCMLALLRTVADFQAHLRLPFIARSVSLKSYKLCSPCRIAVELLTSC